MNHGFTIACITTASSALARQVAELTILAWGRQPTESELAQRAERFLSEITVLEPLRRAVFTALAEGILVGVGRVMCSADDPATWVLYGIAVHPQHQRRGIGHALAKAAILYAEQRGARAIRSDVHADNRASLLFHRGIGFGSEEFLTDIDGDRIARFRLELAMPNGDLVSGSWRKERSR